MRITLTANTDWYLHNFRLDLARALRDAGHEVSMVCPAGEYASRLRAAGYQVQAFAAPSDAFSLGQNRRALGQIRSAFRMLSPDLVHLFTPVCVLLGAIAARRQRIPYVVAALTGLGHVFTSGSAKARAARPGVRWLFKRELAREGIAVVFQNEADRDELISAGVVRPQRAHLVRGSGVDPERFQPRPAPRDDDEIRILFASRLLREKGLNELLAAFRTVRATTSAARLWIAGEVYSPNPTSFAKQELEAMAAKPGVTVLGHVEDMPGLLQEVDIVALPSWREGTPKILLEAAACGLPIVASDIPGCRGVVEDGRSGYLVPVREVAALAEALLRLCGDSDLRSRMGGAGRKIVLAQFTSEIVVRKTLTVYRSLMHPGPDQV